MAVRVAEALDLLTVLRIPWLFETPAIHAGQVSMAHLDEFRALLKMDGVQHMIGVQCPFGAQSSKPTSWIYYRMELEGMPTKCSHQKRTWHNDRTGIITFSRHMPTAGRDTHSLTPQAPMQFGIRRVTPWDSEQSSPYVSEGLAAYPDLLNRFIVAKLRKATYQVRQSGPTFARPIPEDTAAKAAQIFREKLQWRDPLKGIMEPTDKDKADEAAIGGLRNTVNSVNRLSFTAAFGSKLGAKMKKALDEQPAWVEQTCSAIGSNDEERKSKGMPPLRPPPEAMNTIRNLIIDEVKDNIPPKVTAKRTDVDAHLLEGWRSAAKDPETEMFEWLTVGGPMGIMHTPKNVGIFPVVEGTPECSHDAICCNMATFRNYPGVEDQAITGEEMGKHIEKGHLVAFDKKEQLTGYVEGTPPRTPILNKIGLIVKTRNGTTKVRTILDTKQSGVKRMTTKTERITLPRLFDAVLRLLFLMASVTTPEVAVNAFVLDFSDAYWQMPLRDDERKYFCATAKIKGKRKYLAFLRAPQGSTNSGLLWGRLAALVMRLSQSLFLESEVNLMCYVDDPLAGLVGNPAILRRNAALMILVWEALGFKLAYAKGQLGQEVTWIGGTMRAETKGVRAWVKESLISDIKTELARLISSNVISHKDLHSIVGKLGHASGLLIVMRPFLDPLWATLYSKDNNGAPVNTVWTKQIVVELRWFQAFFSEGGSRIERFFSLEAYNRTGPVVEIGTDASPWGMGGWLAIDGIITKFFACKLTEDDARIFDEKLDGSCKGQQLWECLAILVAIDMWSKDWSESTSRAERSEATMLVPYSW